MKEITDFIKTIEKEKSLTEFYALKPVIIAELKKLGGVKTIKKEVKKHGSK